MTASQLLVRPLAPSEVLHFRFGLYVGYATRVRGTLDSAALVQAFAILRQVYPILSARLVLDDTSQPSIEAAPELPAMIDEVAGCIDDPLFGLPDLDDHAAAIHTVRGSDDTATVTLLTHHAIADGHHSLYLLAELWSLYTACVGDVRIAPQRHDYPHSLEYLLDERGIGMGSLALPGDEMFGALADVKTSPGSSEGSRIRLSANETAALRATGRGAGTTINGLVSAALLAGIAQSRGVDIETLNYTYVVDLRARLTPRVGYPEGTNVLSMAHFVADPRAGDDLLALARAITGRLREEIATGAIFAGSSAFMPTLDQPDAATVGQPDAATLEALLSTVVMSTNWGVIPPLSAPADLVIEDFYPIVPSSPIASIVPHVITTYAGQLTIDTTAQPSEESRLLAEHLHALARLAQ
ncbi:hypothetical protein ACIBCN_05505 [Nocardia sp. NPDC051052]|uniref:phthiocerol/phthiodiolone dimycocerosyl transferase family protein n=1 Tax=Nocardia sp. NPDC051052 TaxID=3364322 RepID=UPI0037BA7F24